MGRRRCCAIRTTSTSKRKLAKELAKILRENLGDALDSIVLFGSVARGDAREESDIDLLIVGDRAQEERVFDISLDFELANTVCVSILYYTPEEVEVRERRGYPIIESICEEGIALYDNGFFAELRGRLTSSRR